MSFHENFKHNEEAQIGTEKSFGLIFCAVFGIIAFFPVIFGDTGFRLWAGLLMGFFGFSALYKPEFLTKLNQYWFKFSLVLQKFMVPTILGVMFYGMFTPIAFVLRLFGKKLMGIDYAKDNSYWIKRENYNAKEHMPNQF